MRIRIKTLIALMVTTLFLFLVIQFFSSSFVQSEFSGIEQNDVDQTISRIQVATINRLTQIDSELVSWSQLNSTYEFMQNPQNDTEFEETYLTAASLSNLGINFVIFLDPQGNYMTSMGVNLIDLTQVPVPQDILTKVSNDSTIWNLGSAIDNPNYGFIWSLEGPVMVASSPVLMTGGEGPSAGVLIFARYFDSGSEGTGAGASETEKLQNVLGYPITMLSIADWEKENSIQDDPPSTYIKPLNQQYIIGYDIIDGIDGQPILVIGATMPRTVYDQGLQITEYINEILISAGITFSLIISLLVEFSVLRKLSNLTSSVIKIMASPDQFQKLSVSGNDEITWLTRSINGMIEQIHKQNVKIQKTERMSAIGELARQVGHDLRNPLASMKNAAFYLKRKGSKCTDADRDKMLSIIEDDINRSNKIINDLIEYSTELYLNVRQCSAKTLLKDALLQLQIPSTIQIVDNISEEPKILVDIDRMQRVFASILENAVEAMPHGGTIEVQSSQEDSNVKISFSDTGEGIDIDIRPKIFSPLITTKARGMGLSLAICKRIVDSHGGKIEFESAVGKGTTFRIILPLKPKIKRREKAESPKPDPLLHYKN